MLGSACCRNGSSEVMGSGSAGRCQPPHRGRLCRRRSSVCIKLPKVMITSFPLGEALGRIMYSPLLYVPNSICWRSHPHDKRTPKRQQLFREVKTLNLQKPPKQSMFFFFLSLSPRLTMSLKTPHGAANKCQERTRSCTSVCAPIITNHNPSPANVVKVVVLHCIIKSMKII